MSSEPHHHRAPLCDGFNVQIVYIDLPNDRFQLLPAGRVSGEHPASHAALSSALEGGEKKKVRRAPSRFGGLLAGVFSASFRSRLGIPADVPALKFVWQIWKALVN